MYTYTYILKLYLSLFAYVGIAILKENIMILFFFDLIYLFWNNHLLWKLWEEPIHWFVL